MTHLDLPISLATCGFLGLPQVGLASRVSPLRMQNKIAHGDGGHPGRGLNPRRRIGAGLAYRLQLLLTASVILLAFSKI